MATLKLLWLGQPCILLDEKQVKSEMRKIMAILAYLSLHPGEVSRESLAALFWPESDQQHAMGSLRRALWSLAGSLQGIQLSIDRETVGFADSSQVQIDVQEFAKELQRVKLHHPVENSNTPGFICPGCSELLEEAVLRYRGDFLEGFNLKDCPEFDDWQFFQREGLRAEYAWGLEKLAGFYQQTGEWDRAILHGRAWLALDRLHEPAQRMLTRLYFLSGQKNAAIRQIEECQRLLEQELGQPPEPETLELYKEIRREPAPGAYREQSSPQLEAPQAAANIPLTKTKFFLPKVPRTVIHRQRLVTRLNECVQMPVTLISAPAGFGKTTLLAEWATQSKDLTAWVSLDRGDNDPYRLADYIVNAVRNAFPDMKTGIAALGLLHVPQPVQTSLILGSLINDLVTIPKTVVLVLDDYHAIESAAAHDVINFLLDHRPENLHLVILTRADPPLFLARLRANLQLGDIRMNDLRFTYDETQSFLTQVMGFPLSARDLNFFEEKVEGWIAGIQMASLAMRSNNLSRASSELRSFIRAFKGSQRYILDYLVEEVLDRQAEEVRGFLLHTCILEKLCFELCDSLLTRQCFDGDQPVEQPELAAVKSSQQVLEFLEKSNLFLIPLDDERKWYRYHHLFADLLRTRLHQYEPRLEAELHRRAADWYARHSYSTEAVRHALESGDYSYAADLIEGYSLKLIWMNQIVTTLDWFKSLPPEVIESHPLLTIYQTFILARRGEFERVDSLLANAEAYIKTVPETTRIEEYKTLIFGMRAFNANLKGEPEKAIQFSAFIPSITGKQHITSYIMARAQLAVAYLDNGDLACAERVFGEILQLALESQDIYYSILTNKELAELWSLRGRPSQAEQLYKQMYSWIQQSVQEPAMYDGLVKVYEANLLIEKNELDTACLLLQEDVESLLSVWHSTALYFGYVVLAYLNTAVRDFRRARECVDKAVHWVSAQNVYPRNRSTVRACEVNLWLAEGNLKEAQDWAQENFSQIPASVPFIRELDHICLSRIWVASQRWEEASDLLQRLAEDAMAGKRFGRLLKIDILRAMALHGLGRGEESLELLGGCLRFAYPEGYMRVFLDEGAPLKALLQDGKRSKTWKDPEVLNHAEKLIKAF